MSAVNSGFKGKRGEHKNLRAKQRNAQRKKVNIEKMELAASKKRSPANQLKELDSRLGVGAGAKKERTRLQKLVDNSAK